MCEHKGVIESILEAPDDVDPDLIAANEMLAEERLIRKRQKGSEEQKGNGDG